MLMPLIRVLSLAGPAPAVRLLLLLPRLGVFVPAGREHTAPPGGTCPGLGPRALSGTSSVTTRGSSESESAPRPLSEAAAGCHCDRPELTARRLPAGAGAAWHTSQGPCGGQGTRPPLPPRHASSVPLRSVGHWHARQRRVPHSALRLTEPRRSQRSRVIHMENRAAAAESRSRGLDAVGTTTQDVRVALRGLLSRFEPGCAPVGLLTTLALTTHLSLCEETCLA